MDDDALAYLAITRLQNTYADVVTRRAWAEMEALFLPDAPITFDLVTRPVIEFVGPAALSAFGSRAIESYEFFEFVSINTVVSVGADGTARGRLYTIEPGQLETGEWNTAFGVYHDSYALVDGRWRFSQRHYRTLARRQDGARAEVFPFPEGLSN